MDCPRWPDLEGFPYLFHLWKETITPHMTQKQLKALTQDWAKRLRLQDWDITTTFAPNSEVDGQGRTRYNFDYRIAKIQIVTAETFYSHWEETYDPEQILVHELIHLLWAKLDDYKKGDVEYGLMENAIDRLATALVRGRRG